MKYTHYTVGTKVLNSVHFFHAFFHFTFLWLLFHPLVSLYFHRLPNWVGLVLKFSYLHY